MKNTKKIKRLTRRNDDRISLKSIGKLRALVSPSPLMKNPVEATLLDLSLGGVGLLLHDSCLIKGRYYVKTLKGKSDPLAAVLIWGQGQNAGLRFLAETQDDVQKICDFTREILGDLNREKLVETTLQLFTASQQTQFEMFRALETMIFDQLATQFTPTAGPAEASSKVLGQLIEIRNLLEQGRHEANAPVISLQRKAS